VFGSFTHFLTFFFYSAFYYFSTLALCPVFGGHYNSHAIKDFKSFKSTVNQYPDRTQKDLGKLLKVSASTVCRAMKKVGYTRKKRPTGIKRGTMKREQHI
jgi:hypothetical protein